MSLNAHVNDLIERSLGGAIRAEALVDQFIDEFPDEFDEYADYLARRGLLRAVKDELRRRADTDNGQEALPGLGLPQVIAVPDGESVDFYYRDVRLASAEELIAGRVLRERNVLAAQAKLEEYDDALAALEPYMGSACPVQAWLKAHPDTAVATVEAV